MNKLVIPSLLLGVVMIAGAFAFMPVQEASTVHLSGTTTTTLADDGLTAAKLKEDASNEIQTKQIEVLFDADMTASNVDCTSDSAFLVHYVISEIADGETVTINNDGNAIIVTADISATGTGTDHISGTLGGAADTTIMFDGADTIRIFATIEAPISATAACTSAA